MNCVKCGKDTTDNNVFCPDCLAQMADYPVKPGTPVMIPERNPPRRPPARKFRVPEPEEVIRRQKKLIRLLAVSAAVLFVLRLAYKKRRHAR